MAFKIGFHMEDDSEEQKPTTYVVTVGSVPKKSVVEVHFPVRGLTCSYYNDRFNLQKGDLVYVDGKLEGLVGRVVAVNHSFKIKLSDYKRVIALVDTTVHGQFFSAGSHLLTFDSLALPAEKVVRWFKAPLKEEDEYVSGTDESVFLLDGLKGLEVSPIVVDRGRDYYIHDRVRYLCLDGTRGYAIVCGSEAYEVEFEYRKGEISRLVCSCFCGYNCKHEVAALFQLQETLNVIEEHYGAEYERSGYFAAIDKEMLLAYALDGKDGAGLVL